MGSEWFIVGRCFLGLNKGKVETLFLFTQRMNEAEFLKGTYMRMCVRAKKFSVCAKSWDMYNKTRKLGKFTIFTHLACFTPFMQLIKYFFCILLSKSLKVKFCQRKKSSFRMSGMKEKIQTQRKYIATCKLVFSR